MAKNVVFIACSLDGFIAGPDDDLGFLEAPPGESPADTFTLFFAGVGALLMGRRTFDVVSGLGGNWPYGDTPVLVLTRRPLAPPVPSVRAVSGAMATVVHEARGIAGDRDVYIDGGQVVRQALDADLIDELVVTIVPRILGRGRPLFAGVARRQGLVLLRLEHIGAGYVQLTYRCQLSPAAARPLEAPRRE